MSIIYPMFLSHNNNKTLFRLFNLTRQKTLTIVKLPLVVAITLCVVLVNSVAAASPAKEKQLFIDMMVEKHQFNRADITALFADFSANKSILEAIAKPWEAKPWAQYYPIFLTDKRLEKGLKFWTQYKTELDEAERSTGVPQQIIVAIIGVETFYGSYTGKYSVLDALQTLAFHYPRRATFFRSELEQLLLLAKEEGFDVRTLMGSYAGAMGWGQFIPSSYRAYAVDFDGDGVRDLLNNPADAIGSVANYFKRHGWQKGQAVALPVNVVATGQYKSLLNDSLKPKYTLQQVQAKGVSLKDNTLKVEQQINAETLVKLIEFDETDKPDYWLTFDNFYTITRYNHSPLYAMVVFQLSEQLLHNRAALLATKPEK